MILKKVKPLTLLATLLITLTAFTSLSAFGQQDRWSRIDRDPQQMEKISGYYNQTELNIGTGLGEISTPYSKSLFGVTTVNGYMFNPSFQAGFGTGILKYDAGTVIPLYLDSRYYLFQRRIKIFAGISGGYMAALEKENYTPEIFVNPAAGILVPMKNRSSLTFSAGILTQKDYGTRRASFANFKVGVVLW